MKSTSEYIALLKQFKEEKAGIYGIHKLGLFGSVARGEQRKDSDVDVCIESAPMGLFTLCQLKDELENLFGCSVDILRMRKQLDGSSLQKSVMEDVLYV